MLDWAKFQTPRLAAHGMSLNCAWENFMFPTTHRNNEIWEFHLYGVENSLMHVEALHDAFLHVYNF